MGIDPVTHSPRLDLLDLSSILNSTLYNSSQMNMSRLFGHVQPFVNPELLRLATSLMSSSQQRGNNPSFVLQNAQENHLCEPQMMHQSNIQAPADEIPAACTTLNNSTACVQFPSDHSQLAEPVKAELSNLTTFSSPSSQISEWQQSSGLPNARYAEDCVPLQPSYNAYYCSEAALLDPSSETSTFQSNNSNNQSFSFASVLSTPSSSPPPLNSNSTTYNFGNSTEDERESYCSSMLKLENWMLMDSCENFSLSD